MKTLNALAVAGLMGLSTLVHAGPVEFYTPIPSTGSVTGNLDWDGSADGGYKNVNVKNSPLGQPSKNYNGVGGQFAGYFSAGSLTDDANPISQFFRFFCIDLYQYANAGVHSYVASRYTNDRLAKLYDIAYPNKQVGDFYDADVKTSFGQFSNRDYSAAFQLAVWEITYETSSSLSLNNGTFYNLIPASDAHTIANGWLTQVDAYQGSGYREWQLYRFDSTDFQDYVAARYVPEPSGIALLGLGLAGLGLFGQRRGRLAT